MAESVEISATGTKTTIKNDIEDVVLKPKIIDAFGKKMPLVGCQPHGEPEFHNTAPGTVTGALLASNECEAVYLIQAGCNVDAPVKGIPPILVAPGCVNGTITEILISNGAKLDAKNDKEETALHFAARFGHVDVVKMLLAKGANVNMKSKGRSKSSLPDAKFNIGWTALHEAAEHGELEVVQILLSHGANAHLTTADCKTPEDRARENGHMEIAQILSSVTNSASNLLTSPQDSLVNSISGELSAYLSQLDPLLFHRSKVAMLCSMCSSLRPHSHYELVLCTCHCLRYPSLRQVRLSAAAGCPLCRMLLDCISKNRHKGFDSWPVFVRSGTMEYHPTNGAVRDQPVYMGSAGYGTANRRHSLQVSMDPDENGKPAFVEILRFGPVRGMSSITSTVEKILYKEILTISDSILREIVSNPCFSDGTTDSDDAFQMMAAWMKLCITRHPNCSTMRSIPQLPTRIIDVGLDDSEADPFLFISQGYQAQYITLSYTWGHSLSCTTTLNSLESWTKGMSLESLPKTFQDAIRVTRRLGVRYLWIDALCIIQDSEQDWREEASKMAEVFHNALLTISAADAASPAEGLFRERTRHRARPFLLDPRMSYQRRFELGGGPLCMYGPVVNIADGPRKPRSVLDMRGWIFQEEMLSKRLLVFSKDELFWNCNSLNASESYPDGIPRAPHKDMIDRDMEVFKNYIHQETFIDKKAAVDRLYTSWRAIVPRYTTRLFTKAEDKLIALEGIGTALRKVLGDGISAGLLNTRIAEELLWILDDSGTLPESRLDWRAPTWSWACFDTPMTYLWMQKHARREPMVIFNRAVNTAFQGHMYAVRKIVLHGQLLKVSLRREIEKKKREWQLIFEDRTGSFYPDIEDDYSDTLWALPLVREWDFHFKNSYTKGICLVPVSGSANEYARIGAFSFQGFHSSRIIQNQMITLQ
jgi:hypothetical protein